MRLPKLLRTSSFQLTLFYAALFTASALVLFAVVYGSTSFYMTNQLEAAVDSDLTELQQAFSAAGIGRVARMIDERVRQMPGGPMSYLLKDPGGKVIAGNLAGSPVKTGTFDLAAPARHSRGRRIHARSVILTNGDYLLVGADASAREAMHGLILRAFGWSFAVTLLLACGGGVLVSGRLLRRVETISRAAHEIIAGNLGRRLPMRGTDDEFDHLASSLNAMLDRIEVSVAAIRQVSDDIAHDLRTPLTRLRQHLELAQRKAVSAADLRRAVDRSILEADAVLETFGALLRIAQIESAAPRVPFAMLDLSELLFTVAETYQPAADEKRQSLSVAIAPGLTAWGDRQLLAQMLANLIENAIRHSPDGASVLVAATAQFNGSEIVIADNGPGIPPTEYERVFRRFYRLEASRTTAGNGLGLSLVKAIAGLHAIDIELSDNTPGLRVLLRVPRSPIDTGACDAAAARRNDPFAEQKMLDDREEAAAATAATLRAR